MSDARRYARADPQQDFRIYRRPAFPSYRGAGAFDLFDETGAGRRVLDHRQS